MYDSYLQVNNRLLLEDDSSGFTDADAEAYYNALVVANGGDIDAMTLYGISLDALKSAIDDDFINNKADGVFSKLVHYWPYIGGTAATHAVDAITLDSLMTFVGAPIHGANGVTLNGTTQYINPNNNPNVDAFKDDNHLMQLYIGTDTSYAAGCRDGVTSKSLWMAESGGNKLTDNTNAGSIRINVPNVVKNKVMISTRINVNRVDLYLDGLSIGNSTANNGAGSMSTRPTYFGARNLDGVADVYSLGDIRSSSVGLGLIASEALGFTDNIKALQTALGR